MSLQNKYLKYKNKYLNLKKQIGGSYKDSKFSEYKSAGIMFTDGKHLLAGYQKGATPEEGIGGYFGGIGGYKEKKFDNDDASFTAIREMLEELFDIKMTKKNNKLNSVIIKLITRINTNIPINNFTYNLNNNYITFFYTFEEMNTILQIISEFFSNTNYYDIIPTNIYELISMRKKIKGGEVAALSLLPLQTDLTINNNFLIDIQKYIKRENVFKE